MEDLLAPLDPERVLAYSKRINKTFEEAKNCLHQEAINAAWDQQRTGDSQTSIEDEPKISGSVATPAQFFSAGEPCTPSTRSLRSTSQKTEAQIIQQSSPMKLFLQGPAEAKLHNEETRSAKRDTLAKLRVELYRKVGRIIATKNSYQKVVKLPSKAPTITFYNQLITQQPEVILSLFHDISMPLMFLKQFSKANILLLGKKLLWSQIQLDIRKKKLTESPSGRRKWCSEALTEFNKNKNNDSFISQFLTMENWSILYDNLETPNFLADRSDAAWKRFIVGTLLGYIFPDYFQIETFEKDWRMISLYIQSSEQCQLAIDQGVKLADWGQLHSLLKSTVTYPRVLTSPTSH